MWKRVIFCVDGEQPREAKPCGIIVSENKPHDSRSLKDDKKKYRKKDSP